MKVPWRMKPIMLCSHRLYSKGIINSFAGNVKKEIKMVLEQVQDSRVSLLGIAIDQQTGNLFVSDEDNHEIRKITPKGNPNDISQIQISLFILLLILKHLLPCSFLYLHSEFICSGEVTTIAGSGKKGLVDGDLKSAQFKYPRGIFFDSIEQSLLVCDFGNNKLRKVLLHEGKITN
jgi:DNA-binding beta-propeller fold protein YncE